MKLRRDFLQEFFIYCMGILLGIAWLLPAYNPPFQKFKPASIEVLRLFRIFLPLVFSFGVAVFTGRKRRAVIPDVLLFFSFFAWPLVSWVCTGMDIDRLMVINMPLALSFATIIGFSLWPEWAIRKMLIGIGSTALFLIIFRLARFGIEESTFYSRSRVHLGFDHPLMTGGAVFSVVCGVFLVMESIKNIALRMIVMTIVLVGYFTLLIKVDSRNIQLFSLVLVGVSVLRALRLRTIYWRILNGLLAFTLIFAASSILCLMSTTTISGDVNHDSGFVRFQSFLETADFMTNGHAAIWGASASAYHAFAVTDAVFTSFWIHFGLVGLISIITMFILIGDRLSKFRPKEIIEYIGCAGACALVPFFLLDAQGATAANLAIFMVFVLSYRFASKPVI